MQRELGLTGPQRLAVRIVGCFPGIAPSDLARVLCVDRGTLTGIVERLVSKELVVREPAEHDKRRICLTLSAAGRRFNREQSGTVEAAAQQVLRTCSSAQVAATIALIEALIAELGRGGVLP
jgi:DNA-binding MarR family transcriptional regulator